MSTLRNRVILIGNLGAAPEMRSFDNNGKLARFSLATNETYKNQQGEKVTETQWHQVVAWNGLAKLAESYLKKGQQIALEGKITSRSYEDKEGKKRYTTEIVASDIVLLGAKDA